MKAWPVPSRLVVWLPTSLGDAVQATAAGVRTFHCCNTLPVPAGGLSGAPLKPVSLQCIARVQELAGAAAAELRIVGGGGIREVQDVDDTLRPVRVRHGEEEVVRRVRRARRTGRSGSRPARGLGRAPPASLARNR